MVTITTLSEAEGLKDIQNQTITINADGIVFEQDYYPFGKKGVNHGVISGCVFEATVIRHAVYIQKASDILIENNVIYGTNVMNDQSLLSALVTTGLTSSQFDDVVVTQHMTRFDYAFEYKGCTNVRIVNNYLKGGIGFMNGMADANGNVGTMFLIKDNTAVEFDNSQGAAGWINVSGILSGDAVVENSNNLAGNQ